MKTFLSCLLLLVLFQLQAQSCPHLLTAAPHTAVCAQVSEGVAAAQVAAALAVQAPAELPAETTLSFSKYLHGAIDAWKDLLKRAFSARLAWVWALVAMGAAALLRR